MDETKKKTKTTVKKTEEKKRQKKKIMEKMTTGKRFIGETSAFIFNTHFTHSHPLANIICKKSTLCVCALYLRSTFSLLFSLFLSLCVCLAQLHAMRDLKIIIIII